MTEGKYSDEKLDDSWSKDTAGTLTLNKDSITSDDKTVQIDKTTATITKAGTYILTGTLTDGQIIVDAENKGDVKLVLNDADINCSSSAPIYIKSGNTVITLADGTENSVSDGKNTSTKGRRR
ncbi:MAG: carbohydrate-binding domain-containing protein [Lachnoclostridium sp.]